MRIRNIFVGGILVLSMAFCGVGLKAEVAQAACGFGLRVGSEDIACGQGETSDGTVKAVVENGVWKITLNNYNGGAIRYAGCGGPDGGVTADRRVVELIGKNTITAKGGIGFDVYEVEFVGDGTLTITAMVPIGGGMLTDLCDMLGSDGEQRIMWAGIDADTLRYVMGNTTITVTGGTIVDSWEMGPNKTVPSDEADDNNVVDDDEKEDTSTIDELQKKYDDLLVEKQKTDIAMYIGYGVAAVLGVALAIVGVIFAVRKHKNKHSKEKADIIERNDEQEKINA